MSTPILRAALAPAALAPAGPAAVGRGARTRPFSTVDVHADPRAVVDEWRSLAGIAPASPYQSPDWVMPWVETIGVEAGIAPLIVVARDGEGRPSALLPLGLSRWGRLGVASFLGAKDSNFNMGLFRPDASWTGDALRDLLQAAASAGPARVDLYAFRNQPHAWQGSPNPMAGLPHQPSPSFAHATALGPDAEAVMRDLLSRDTRKKLRQKLNRLRGMGAVSLIAATDGAATDGAATDGAATDGAATDGAAAALLDAFVQQRAARNASSGLGVEDLPGLRRFLDRAMTAGGPVAMYGLRCGDRIVATLAGARAGGRFCGMLTSFDADPEVARTSPGELLLIEVIKLHCAEGFTAFDLGVGEARYKESYCPEVQPLFDTLLGTTPAGRLSAAAEAARLRVKRSVKQSRWAWPLAQRLRRLGAG